jgi:tripartite-type tricarboxylate transporter receptor subunit TctC
MKFARILLALLVALVAGAALAEAYPNKPVRLVVPFTPGSGQDVLARIVAPKLAELWGEQLIVENHAGAGGSIASGAVAKSAPDGYTLLWHSTAFATNPVLYGKLPYDPLRDLLPITSVVRQPFVLVTSPSSGASTVAELVSAAQARPGQVSYGSAGVGTGTHFAAEKFRLSTRINAVHVPYKGAEVNLDVIAGRVTYWFAPIVLAASSVREGKLRALSVTSAQRVPQLPDVPTMAEAGVQDTEYSLWSGLWAPAGTPSELVDKIAKDIARVLAQPSLREQLERLGAEPMAMNPSEFARFVRLEMEEAARVGNAAGMEVQR